MKKILLLFTAAGLLSLTSCNNDDDVVVADGNNIAEVFQVNDVDFLPNDYQVLVPLDPALYAEDVILVYRQTYDASANVNVWQLIPRTIYLSDGGEVDYDYNFTVNDLLIYMDANFNLNEIPGSLTQNQVFRIAIIPGSVDGTAKGSNLEKYKDYDTVAAQYGITEGDVKTLKVK